MTVVAYVSGHGLGHSSREVEILRRLPEEIPLIVKTAAPEWFWRQEVTRPFDIVPEAYDVGAVQTTSLEVDIPATLAAWREVDSRNQARADSEAEFLRQCGARLVVADVAPFPITVAARLGIASICVANFTWADIYAEYIAAEPGFGPVVDQLTEDYAKTTLLLEAGLALPMPYFRHREVAGIVARKSQPRREELLALLGEKARGKRLALIYAGNWGLPVPWEQLAAFTDWHFLSLAPLGDVAAANVSHIPQAAMPHQDFVASVDLVISKAGYGIVGECLSSGTPFLYCPRHGFAEYAVLNAVLSAWPGGFLLPSEKFLSADWAEVLGRIPSFGSLPPQFANGGPSAAHQIASLWAKRQ